MLEGFEGKQKPKIKGRIPGIEFMRSTGVFVFVYLISLIGIPFC